MLGFDADDEPAGVRPDAGGDRPIDYPLPDIHREATWMVAVSNDH